MPLADLLRIKFGLTREQAATYEVLSGFDIEMTMAPTRGGIHARG